MKILNLGSLNVDYVYKVDKFLLPGETKSSLSLNTYCGGKDLISPLQLQRPAMKFIMPQSLEKAERCSKQHYPKAELMSI